MLHEDPSVGDQRHGKVKVLAERGTDTVSVKVDSAAKQLKIVTGADVRIGRVEPEIMTIVRDDADALVAIQVTNTAADVFTVHLDRKSGNAVWGKAALGWMGLVGWSHYLECRSGPRSFGQT